LQLSDYDRVVEELGERFGLKVDPKAKVWQLSVGEQQRIEILKMLYRGADVLIMDEPTAVLAPQEIEGLFETLRTMAAEGKSVIFISHKLQEVTKISDRISVLRRGKMSAAGIETSKITRQELANLMVGREVIFSLDKQPKAAGKVVLSVIDLEAENDKGLPALQGISFEVSSGEIVGMAGVAGNGQSELAEVLSGMRACSKGKILLNEVDISNKSTRDGIKQGLGYIPEDRTHVGTAPNLSVTDNVIMKKYRQSPIARGWMIDQAEAIQFANELKDDYDIIVPTVETPVRLLSGGNLQRVILAREISGEPALMLAMQPTRGLDVGAIEGVQRLLLEQRDAGAAILLVSEELEELLTLSDRLLVIYEGQIMGEVTIDPQSGPSADIETIGLMMTGTPLEQIETEGVA
jgi:simple sugar transport system ATP-binding protein